jgi:hypothetical protein
MKKLGITATGLAHCTVAGKCQTSDGSLRGRTVDW